MLCIGLLVPAHAANESNVDEVAVTDSSSDEEVVAEAVQKVTWEDLAVVQETIVQQYIAASLQISKAQYEMAIALDLKKQAAVVKAEADALGADSVIDKKQVNRHTKVSKKTNKLIRNKLKKKKELDKERRVQFTKGLIWYSEGISLTSKLIEEMGPFAASVSAKATQTAAEMAQQAKTVADAASQGPLGWVTSLPKGPIKNPFAKNNSELTAKFATGLYITKAMPPLFGSHGSTMGQVVKFMQSNNIAVPDDATQALAGFDGTKPAKKSWASTMSSWVGLPGPVPACDAQAGSHCLWVDVVPQSARVILPDIKPRYAAGMALSAKKYRVRVKAEGYQSKDQWIDLTQKSQRVKIQLTPES